MTLATELLAYDAAHPGDPDALVEVDGETWARWVALATVEAAAAAGVAPLCWARDGERGAPCFLPACHGGAHSNGSRTWRERKRRAR